MNRKQIISLSAAAIVVIALTGYVFILPGKQVSSYKAIANDSQSKLNEKVNKVNEILDSDTFVKTELEPSKIHADVKTGRESIKDAKNTLTLVEKDLTTFDTLPGVGWNSVYKPAKELRNNEQKYVDDTRRYLNELDAVLTYFDENANLDKEFQKTMDDLATASDTSETPDELAKQVDTAVANLQANNNKFAALSTPSSLKEGHIYMTDATNKLIQLFKDMSAAIKAEDESKLEKIYTDVENLTDEVTQKTDDYNAEFIRNSSLRQLDDKLNDLDRTIDRQITQL